MIGLGKKLIVLCKAYLPQGKYYKTMLYKKFHELQLSCLGMGAMRLPKTGEGEKIDEAKAREIIEYAYNNGINYFDTAYRYHAGESEVFVGKVLSQYPRESFYLATKFPGHMIEELL